MFNPNEDRVDYGQILAPPSGYELDFAVGTTYSLDLDALVGATLALGLSMETDSALMNNPVCLLEALRTTGDKVVLFCESGQIHLPGNVNSLYILLEKMVFSVKTVRRRGIAAYPSFHPKCWLIRYVNKAKEIYYRFIILSRNLTFDRSWDITCALEGKPGEETEKNEPLCDFLRYLSDQLPSGKNGRRKARGIREMVLDLAHVNFQLESKAFHDFEFIPNGIRKTDGSFYQFDQTPLFKDTFHEIAIISPFISADIIRNFNDRNKRSPIENTRYMLITRQASLKKLKIADADNFELYTMKDNVIDGEASISADAETVQQQDIHAKMYMIRKHSKSDLYLGSLNASHNAVFGNVEFMLRLRAYRYDLNMDRLKQALFGRDPLGPDNPFQPAELKEDGQPDPEKGNQLDRIIKDICRKNPSASVLEQENKRYDIAVRFGETDLKGTQVTVRPLLSQKKLPYDRNLLFSSLDMLQLSSFYAVSVSNGEDAIERVIIIPTKGLPDEREKAVVSGIVSNRDCFYRYVAFLLGDDSVLAMAEPGRVQETTSGAADRRTYVIPALYEKMLQTAADEPEKLDGIEYLMKSINEDGIVPEGFKKLYETIRKAVKKRG